MTIYRTLPEVFRLDFTPSDEKEDLIRTLTDFLQTGMGRDAPIAIPAGGMERWDISPTTVHLAGVSVLRDHLQ